MAGGGRIIRPLLPVVIVAALLGLGLLAAAFGNPSIEALPGQLVQTTGAPAPEETIVVQTAEASPSAEEYASAAPTRTPAAAVLVLAALLALVAAAVLVWWLRRSRTSSVQLTNVVRPHAPDLVRGLMWGAIDRGLDELAETDTDPRRAVIACWAGLEAAAAGAGTPRGPSDTSTDLVLRLLGAHRVSVDVLADFAAVYREARFATHVVDDAMRAQARAALHQLRDELSAGVGR